MPARAGARRRRRLLPAAALATVAATVTGLIAPPWGAAAAPERALQAVQVHLSPTGAVTGLTSTVIERNPTSFSSHTVSLDPAGQAGKLPVRVTTSYLLNGQPGTDLNRLSGARGTVEVDVTVTNTTLRPERVPHRDLDGVPSSSYALVATPMTVVAQASLPSGSAKSVVTRSLSDPTTTAGPASTTNGVVSTAGDSGNVVWSALLAPPQLSPTTTFRLVEQTDHFVMPSIHLTVQPGVQTDPSLAHLLGASIGSQPAADLVAVQNAALLLVDRIDGRLTSVTRDLTSIARSLQQQAEQIGPQTTARLQSIDGDIRASAGQLTADLTTLNGKVARGLQSNTGQADSAIAGVVAQLDQRLGVAGPAGFPTSPPAPVTANPAPTPGAECAPASPGRSQLPGGTLIGQLDRISGQVEALAGSTGACSAALQADLTKEIGSTQTDCTSNPGAVLCGVRFIAEQTTTLLHDLDEANNSDLKQIEAQLSAGAYSNLKTDTGNLASAVGAVSNAADAVTSSLSGFDISQLLAALQAATDAQSAVDGDVAALHTLAGTEIGLLDDQGPPGQPQDGVLSELQALTALVCSASPTDVATDGPTQLYTQKILELLNGPSKCPNDSSSGPADDSLAKQYQTPIGSFLTADAAAWHNVQDATDPSNGSLAQDLGKLSTALSDVKSAVGGTTDPGSGLHQLAAAVQQLTSGGAPTPSACSAGGLPALQTLQCGLTGFTGAQDAAGTTLHNLVTAMRTIVHDDIAGTTDQLDTSILDSADRATQDFQRLLGGVSDAAQASAEQILGQGGRLITAEEQRLAASHRLEGRRLSDSAQQAIAQLAGQFGTARRTETTAGAQLAGEIRQVIGNIGSPTGSGLLNAVAADARIASANNADVRQAGSTGRAYTTVGQAALDEDLLQRAQLARGLDQAATFRPFGIAAPAAHTSTVFVFVIGGAA